MQTTFCKILAVPLLALAGCCAFGFLATFEPMPPAEQWTWRVVYVVMGLCCLWASARLWRSTCKPAPNRKPLAARR
jgi:predicted membrane channel-forming protein YqfA (hemolysin III family)